MIKKRKYGLFYASMFLIFMSIIIFVVFIYKNIIDVFYVMFVFILVFKCLIERCIK